MSRKKFQFEIPVGDANGIWERGKISGFELVRIGAWKSAKSVALLTVNSESFIESCTANAMEAIMPFKEVNVIRDNLDWDEWQNCVATAIGRKKQPRSGLLRLEGVGYPVATAILSILAPSAFPVLDKWAISAVFGVPVQEASRGKWHRAAMYTEYCRRLATEERPEFDATMNIHGRDVEMMKLGKANAQRS